MALVSKDRKNVIKDELDRRDLNTKSIMNIIKYSLNGIKVYIDDGKSFIIYSFCTLLEIILGFVFKVNGLEWILLICMLGIILAVELINTAIENVCDSVTKEYNLYIKAAKDCASGATFVIFIVMCILNIIIFYPKIIVLF